MSVKRKHLLKSMLTVILALSFCCGFVLTAFADSCITHDYDYENAVWSWDEDYETAVCTVTCLTCGEVTTLDADIVASESADVTCTTDGYTTYTAVVTYETEQAYAVYDDSEASFTFYYGDPDDAVLEDGDIIYLDSEYAFMTTDYTSSSVTASAESVPWCSIREDVVTVSFDESFADQKPLYMTYWFYGFTSVTEIDMEYLDTSEVISFNRTFMYCSIIEELDVSDWDISSATSLQCVFAHCYAIKELDVSGWDTSNVTTIWGTFVSCRSLTELDVTAWDTSNVTTAYCAFQDCISLTTLDLSTWDTSSLENLINMFRGCTSLVSVSFADWDTSSALSFNYMFFGCSSLTDIDVSGWDTSSLIGGSFVFYGCSSLEYVDVSNWDTSNVTALWSIFYGCTSLKSIDVSNWDTSNVEDMGLAFAYCSSLTSLDLSSWEVSSAVYIDSMFRDCTSLVAIDISGWSIGSITTNYGEMFNGCSELKYLYIGDSDTLQWLTDTADSTGLSADDIIIGITNGGTINDFSDAAFATDLSKYGYFFNGWYTDSDCTDAADEYTEGNVYYAGWTVNVEVDTTYPTDDDDTDDNDDTDDTDDTDALETAVTVDVSDYTYYSLTEIDDSTIEEDYVIVDGGTYTLVSIITITTEAATGHTWDDGVVTAEATCTTAGIITYTCTVCGDTMTEEIAALGHDYELTETVDATCTEDGYYLYTCTACGATKTEAIAAIGHDYVLTETVDATCTEAGYYLYTCQNDSSHTYTETISALGHTDSDGDGYCDECGEEYDLGNKRTVCLVNDLGVTVTVYDYTLTNSSSFTGSALIITYTGVPFYITVSDYDTSIYEAVVRVNLTEIEPDENGFYEIPAGDTYVTITIELSVIGTPGSISYSSSSDECELCGGSCICANVDEDDLSFFQWICRIFCKIIYWIRSLFGLV